MDTHSPVDFEPPPPAYEVSQHELDQKVSRAIEHSLTEALPTVDEHGFPVYDAAAFEAVAFSYQGSGAGSSALQEGSLQEACAASVAGDVKLSIAMGAKAFHDKENDGDRELVQRGFANDSEVQDPRRRSAETDPYQSSPPPAFASVAPSAGPSTIGPTREDVARLYHPDSRTPSPLSSPPPSSRDLVERAQSPHLPVRQSRQSTDGSSSRRRSPRYSVGSQTLLTSRLDFNPSLAYNKCQLDPTEDPSMAAAADATAFYSHAVAYHLTGGPSNTSPMNRPTPSDSPYHVPRQPSSLPPAAGIAGPYQSSSISHMQSAPLRPNSAAYHLPPSGFHRPTFPQRGSTPSNAETGSEPSNGASQWAMSEAQMVRDLYRSRN